MKRSNGTAVCAALAYLLALPADAGSDAVAMPSAKFPVHIERSVLIPMRDGIRLSTDLYLPRNAGKRLPVILIRSQYDKSRDDIDAGPAQMFAGQGFIVAVQDIRGRFESEGEYTLAENDATDGYDTVDWLAGQPWSNGKVGTYGCSSAGITQVFQAQLRHPALAAMIPQASGGATRAQLWDVVTAGVPELGWSLEWFHETGGKRFERPLPGLTREQRIEFFHSTIRKVAPAKLSRDAYAAILTSLPVKDMAAKAAQAVAASNWGGPPSDWEDYMTRDPGDPRWKQLGFFDDRSRIDVPSLWVNSWNDFSVGETLYLFDRFRRNGTSARARNNQFVIISPAGHCGSEYVDSELRIDGRELGDARKNYWAVYLQWFDHWLRGRPGDFLKMPKVQYYVIGANEWRSAQEWPLPNTQFTKYYLRSEGQANSRYGDGALSTMPALAEPSDRYVYDPALPVPSAKASEAEIRHDVLVYSTPPLAEGMEVTGPIEVVLYVSSSARDTDFTANLVDVQPDGSVLYVRNNGIARARYREGLDRTVWMEEGKIYQVRIDLQATSLYFPAGHRIRLQISSSNFPRYARNLNTGGNNQTETEWVVARNTVHHTQDHPSHVLLPIVPNKSLEPLDSQLGRGHED